MTYIKEAQRVLLKELDDEIVLTAELSYLYTLLVLTMGESCTSQHVHDAWSVATSRRRPDHRSLVPFADLAPEVQVLADEFRDAIRRAAKRLKEGVL